MAGSPSAVELVAAVREFMAGLALEGRDAFHARVAANALAIVERELAGNADATELAALLPFVTPTRQEPGSGLKREGEAAAPADAGGHPLVASKPSPGLRRGDGGGGGALRAFLCTRIRCRDLTPATPGLIDALIVATCARLAVDNPRYATLARLAADAALRR